MTDKEIFQEILDDLNQYQINRQDFDRFFLTILRLKERLEQPDKQWKGLTDRETAKLRFNDVTEYSLGYMHGAFGAEKILKERNT